MSTAIKTKAKQAPKSDSSSEERIREARRYLKEHDDRFADALLLGTATGDAVDGDKMSSYKPPLPVKP